MILRTFRKKSILTLFLILLVVSIAWAAQSYYIASGASQTINEWGVQKKVTNGCGPAIFVPTNSSAEWTAFRNNKPSCVTLADIPREGYFVMTWSTYTGLSLNGLSGANNLCLVKMAAYDWKGKADAQARGLITNGKVRAFFCDNATCNMGTSNTRYSFAQANRTDLGGSSFTTDSSGMDRLIMTTGQARLILGTPLTTGAVELWLMRPGTVLNLGTMRTAKAGEQEVARLKAFRAIHKQTTT